MRYIYPIRCLFQRETLFSLKVRAFYGDGERKVKVKVNGDDNAQVCKVPTKKRVVNIESPYQNFITNSINNYY